MRRIDLKLTTTKNTFSIDGRSVTDLDEVKRYMDKNSLTELTGTEADIKLSDFIGDAQRITEELFEDAEVSGGGLTIVDDSIINGIVDNADDGTAQGFIGA